MSDRPRAVNRLPVADRYDAVVIGARLAGCAGETFDRRATPATVQA
jgi:hypothetical protein